MMDPDLSREITQFCVQNNIDEAAANTLRMCNSAIQRCVLGRGDLGGARNPSSALLTRIKDAKLMGLDPNGEAAAALAGSWPSGMCAAAGLGHGHGHGGSPQPYGGGLTYVKCRGLPFSANVENVMSFFAVYQVTADQVIMGINAEGRASGEAFVQFPTEALAREAVRDRNRQRMEHRYIELFVMTASEVQRARLPDAEHVTTSAVPPPGLQHLQPGYNAAAAASFGYVPMSATSLGLGGAASLGASSGSLAGLAGALPGLAGALPGLADVGVAAAGNSNYIHQLAAYYGSYEAAAQALGAVGMGSSAGIAGLPGLAGLGAGGGAAAVSTGSRSAAVASAPAGSMAELAAQIAAAGLSLDTASLGGWDYGAASTALGHGARASPY